nr:AarF/ABC1/UbiB kinase family protein [Gemmatimonadaceae bacterium]
MLLAPSHLPRLAATVSLFTKYGLKDFAVGQGLRVIAPEEFTDDENEQTDVAERATAFRKRLVELGPAFVKLGQVLSTRPDLLPDPYIAELEHLQDNVGPIPLSEVEDLIQSQLGGRLSKLFASFDENPIGTASLGQVHAAELRDGRAVVVKVQRPGIRDPLAQDMEFFHEVAEFLTA